MKARSLMIQGTGSSVGKSVIVAGLCRLLAQAGYRVAPFKSQNMALNSYVTWDGREMGRAQVVQALAAGLEPQACFNPILLKPKGDTLCQVIVDGHPVADMPAATYHGSFRPRAWQSVKRAYDKLSRDYDVIVIEGAGSPAEVNLIDQDIVNMRVAELTEAPVILVADIDRGGALAAVVGTMELLEPVARERVKGFIINKFRGARSLLEPALSFLENRTGRKVAGVIPFSPGMAIPEEDTLADLVQGEREGWEVDLAVVRLPHLANFTDFDALGREPGVRVRYLDSADSLDGADAIILPGTKNTVADLSWLKEQGLARAITEKAAAGCPVVGICGGFQMLGQRIEDRGGLEAQPGTVGGLGLMPVVTWFERSKVLRRVRGRFLHAPPLFPQTEGVEIEGYEIHHGRTVFLDSQVEVEPMIEIFDTGKREGYCLQGRAIFGTYLHGYFDNDEPRRAFLDFLRARKGLAAAGTVVSQRDFLERALNEWAATLAAGLDLSWLSELLRLEHPLGPRLVVPDDTVPGALTSGSASLRTERMRGRP